MTQKNTTPDASSASHCYPTFVNINGDWVNPHCVVSVIHHDAVRRTNDTQPQKVVVTLTSGDTISLPNRSPRDACAIVDKLEGRKGG